MLLEKDEIDKRIESPLNLLNRLRSHKQAPREAANVYNIDKVMPDIDTRLREAKNSRKPDVGEKAIDIIMSAMDELKDKIPEIQKPEKLSSVIRDMSQVIKNTESEKEAGSNVQFIFKVSGVNKESDYEVIDVA